MIYSRYIMKDVGQKHIPKLAENPQLVNISFDMDQANFKGHLSNILALSRFIPKKANTTSLKNKSSNAIYPEETINFNKK